MASPTGAGSCPRPSSRGARRELELGPQIAAVDEVLVHLDRQHVLPGDQRITIEQETRTADAYGGAATAWTTLATTWAAVKPLSARRATDNAAPEEPASYRFTLRRRADVTDTMRIAWNGQTFNIRFVADPGARGLYMTIDAERGVAQ